MRRLTVAILGLLVWSLGLGFELASCAGAVDEIVGGRVGFEVGTFNLRFFTDLDKTTGAWCEGSSNRSRAEIEALAAFIDSLDLEVLALQEVESAEAIDLLLSSTEPGKYGYVISTQADQCQRVAVMYQRTDVAVSFLADIPLTLGNPGLRDGLVVRVHVLESGHDFTLVTVHLKSGSDERSTLTRHNQIRVLSKWIADYLADPESDPDLILTGDFNETFLSKATSFSLLSGPSDLRLLTQDAPCVTCTPPGAIYNDPIDHIIVSASMAEMYFGDTVFLNYFADATLAHRETFSDHCIVWSTFGAPPPPPLPDTLRAAGLKPGDIIISSVLANAPGSDKIADEYFTLLNRTDKRVDLRGIAICDEQACWTIPHTMAATTIGPGETWRVYGSTYNPTSSTQGIALRNSGEEVKLKVGDLVLDYWRYPETKDGVPAVRRL